ncbi:MAG TPA: BrxA/BrxB family bacilliredoxin [Bacillales bacterium]|nr:BrxA/BrxB family bacilliredoxin [Bacillales bacterium]
MNADYDLLMADHVRRCREELTSAGYEELRTPEEVDQVLKAEGTTLVAVNSVCGCAGGVARPTAAYIINYDKKPDRYVSVFAGQDKEATERARSYFTGYAPSSPSFALVKDGKIVKMVERFEIEGHQPIEVAQRLQQILDEHCQ